MSAPIESSSIDMDELAYLITADNEHPVMRCVREWEFESALYPANMYHGIKEQDEDNKSSFFNRAGRITWSLPGHDKERPKTRGCGYIREKGSKGDEGIRFTSCSSDHGHYARGRRNHCWSLFCPVCCNDAALRTGDRAEVQLQSYRILMEKQGRDPGPLGHWTISPPQEDIKIGMQFIDTYNTIRKHTENQLQENGAIAGILMFHPWRQGDYMWNLAPHFHSVLYGFIDTDTFRESNPGWVIKKIHPNEELISVGQTVAYIATHMGLGLIERDVSEVDYDLRFLSYMLPGLSDDDYRSSAEANGTYGAGSGKMFRYTDDDILAQAEGRGRMVGDVSGLDWLKFTMDPLCYATRLTYFGLTSQRKLRTIATETEYRTRYCRICNSPLNVYSGLCDVHGEQSLFLHRNTIKTFSEHYDTVKHAINELKDDLKDSKIKLGTISPDTSLIVSKDEVTSTTDPI